MQLEKLKKVQSLQIEIMDEIHKICVENNINYYIIGGTALGAIRHGGFIPWDIDIDIAMFRLDYENFKMLAKKLPARLNYIDYESESDYFPPHALVAIKDTQIKQKDDHLNPNLKRYGIFLDIFPLDQASNDYNLQKKQADALKKIARDKRRKMAISYAENFWLKIMVKKIVASLYSPIKMYNLNSKQQFIMKQYNNEIDCKNWCSMASHYSYEKQCMPKEIYGKPTLVKFENREYYGPENIDEYLKRIFGDYMKLPSKESQQKQIDYFIDAKW